MSRNTNLLSTSTLPRIYSDIRCLHCQSNALMLLDEDQLYQKSILSFVQLHPCGHTYCTRCFERILLKSANQSQPASCSGQYLLNGQNSDCRLEVLVPKSAGDKVVVEARECRFETPTGNILNIGELRLSLLEQRERIAPGQVVIRSSRAQTQPELDARNAASPVWVFVTMSTNLERLWQLVRERRSDGRLFHKLSNDAQHPMSQRYVYSDQNSGGGLHFIREAGTYTDGADERHVVRNEAAILTVAPPPPILNHQRATSGDTQLPNPNAPNMRGEPDNFSYRNVANNVPAVTNRNGGRPTANVFGNMAPLPPGPFPHNNRTPESVYGVDDEGLIEEFRRRPR